MPAQRDRPVLSQELLYLWQMWREMSAARQSGGMAPNPLSYADIEAYCRLTDERLDPWEARAIRAIDDAFLGSLVADQAEGAPDVS